MHQKKEKRETFFSSNHRLVVERAKILARINKTRARFVRFKKNKSEREELFQREALFVGGVVVLAFRSVLRGRLFIRERVREREIHIISRRRRLWSRKLRGVLDERTHRGSEKKKKIRERDAR